MNAEPTLEDVARQYPGWNCWRGINGLVYAHRGAPGETETVVRGEDPMDLRDQIVRAESWMDCLPA